ncbi:Na+-transporting NADH:ubiquinone oxidoreductase subunit C [Alkalispirochaeta americana]|uniref:Na+-transporting NADH:ubiquinone oxidoreductase subunit C n=1 Tax=Alkalispirochaeta americana TaxID=159291 RepID=A0A1N6NY60_9SPIO|nr:FMN-binding protein [Alkalispirochaeta americana]SIP97078.1 Na+-transporting NADH:ubiquinone oxidoreductase subunit C [Alkalispirochaeta americana]
MNKQSLPYTIGFTFFISFIFVLFLSFAHHSTAPRVEQNREVTRQRSILSALGVEASTPAEVQKAFKTVEEVEQGGITLFRFTEGETRVYAKEFVGSGVWGPIEGILAVTGDMARARGLEIVDQTETPGLGGRITERWFKEQLRDLRIVDGTIRVAAPGEGDSDKENGKIDAITGATRTSERMGVIFKNELERIASALGVEL